MKVVIDALASPEKSGGMRLHAEEVIRTWSEDFPKDRLLVIGPSWCRVRFRELRNVRVLRWPNDSAVWRITGEMVVVPLVARLVIGHRLLSLSPVLSPLVPRRRSFSVAHDWRHVRHPSQFSRAQRLYRRIWISSLKRSRVVMAISVKTKNETLLLNRSATVAVVPNGSDHARRWPSVPPSPSLRSGKPAHLITFGHKNHKRPDLAIRALPMLKNERDASLTVFGAEGEYREQLVTIAESLGVRQQCRFPGFVSEPEYQAAVSTSAAVLLLCADDGFGLPLSEANYFSIPGIVTTDGGLADVHPDSIVVMPDAGSVAAGIDRALVLRQVPRRATSGWSDTVAHMRRLVGADDGERR